MVEAHQKLSEEEINLTDSEDALTALLLYGCLMEIVFGFILSMLETNLCLDFDGTGEIGLTIRLTQEEYCIFNVFN